MLVRLQRLDATIGTDLGWTTVAELPLTIEGFDADALTAGWTGGLEMAFGPAARRPGAGPSMRVAIEETEWLDADPEIAIAPGIVLQLPKLPRIVYLDHLEL